MGKLTIYKDKIVFTRRDELTVVEPYGRDCVRCRFTRNSKVSDERWTLLDPQPCSYTITGDENAATITNGMISVTVKAGDYFTDGKIIYYRKGTPILRTKHEGDWGNRAIHTESDHFQYSMIFEANPGEHLYGLGQEQEDQFDRKGSTSRLVHYNTKTAMPVLYSSLGYGFLWNNPGVGRCEATNNHTMWVADSAYQVDYLVYAGETPSDVLQRYCDLTGYPPVFPEWAAGFWQCKLRYESQEDFLEVAREYHKRGIPVAAMVIDFFHWTEQGDWKFDPKYWPDPEGMCKELEELGIHPVVSVWPTINPKSENWNEMNERNLLIRSEQGPYPTLDFHGMQTSIDPMNPKTPAFVWDKVKKNYYDKGIRTFWLDNTEPEAHPVNPANFHYYLGNGMQTALLYPYYYTKLIYDGLKEAGETEPISLARAAYPGSQKFGTVVWNGDVNSTFEALRMSVKAGLSMGVCGIPWWNSDIGGFFMADTESEYFRELIVRWFQFGLFCPVMRLHGVRKRPTGHVDRHPGIIEPSGGDNEIWSFGEKNYPILRELIELRERLRPYIMKAMKESTATGAPVMRPMFWEFPDDPICYTLEDQYFFGPDILFAPIVDQGRVDRSVYLPEGEWIRVGDRQEAAGGQTITCHAEIDEFIAFVRKGSDVLAAFDR